MMKTATLIAFTSLLGLLSLNGQKANTLSDEEKAGGWILLFDGKSTDGWLRWGSHKPLDENSKWQVVDNALSLTGKGGGDIYTKEAFENYELVLEWKTQGNSGIFVRVDPSHKGAIWNKAPEMQVNRENNPRQLKSTSAGGLYQLYDIEGPEKVIKGDDWNEVRIRIKDDHATYWFNGKKTCEFTFGDDGWNERVQRSKFKKYPGFGLLKKGHIGVQDHGAKVSFRNIRLKQL
jgi:hypothetical protein